MLRKGDFPHLKGKFLKQNQLRIFKVSDSFITEIGIDLNSNNLLLFIHGGAFISGPSQHHWDIEKNITEQINHKIWMCDYPKAPKNKITKITKNLYSIYSAALEVYQPNQIVFIGDSAGGTLVTSLIQRLIKNKIELPRKITLVSPVMDSSMSNPEIGIIDNSDPILSKKDILSAKKTCIENDDLKIVVISLLYGIFEKFPSTVLFFVENDITYPDQKLAVEKFIEAKINLEIIEGKNIPHIWPFPVVMREAKTVFNKIISTINI